MPSVTFLDWPISVTEPSAAISCTNTTYQKLPFVVNARRDACIPPTSRDAFLSPLHETALPFQRESRLQRKFKRPLLLRNFRRQPRRLLHPVLLRNVLHRLRNHIRRRIRPARLFHQRRRYAYLET